MLTLKGLPVLPLIKCLTENDGLGLLDIESNLSVSKAMNSTQIYKLSRAIERRNVIKAIAYLTLRLSDSFNVKQKFTDEQASMLALDLAEVLHYETLEDVVMMYKYARQGKIGSNEYKLDGQTVMQKWVPEYLELKAIEKENEHLKNKGEKNGMTFFEWKKEDLDKFKVDNIETIPVKLGQRMKEKINVPIKPQIIVKDRKQYLEEMYYQVRKMTDGQLKDYLVKCDVNKTNETDKLPFDQDIFELVENEIDRRKTT